MRVSLSLLQKFFSSPLPLKQIIEACDRIGIEAEVETTTHSSVVTAKILTTTPHPNANNLVIATLFDGSTQYQIICGAPNCQPGIIVPLALPGAQVYDKNGHLYTIKKSKLRGEESQGMCCGADELGFPHLQTQEKGLFVFPKTTPLGEDVYNLLSDTSIEFSLTPNLSHCASLLGLAREIAHVSPTATLSIPENFSFAPLPVQVQQNTQHDLTICPFFCYVKISGVSSQPSSQEIQDALKACKYKPINAVVDITNYIMLSLGQPLHAYNAQAVDCESLRVQAASSPHILKLLNNEEIFIPEGIPVICDKNNHLALAGVMGSLESSFQDTTTEIILESAYFCPKAIRKSQTQLPIHSEAAYRFSRGTDSHNVLPALYAAIHYIKKFFPNVQVSPIRTLGKESPREILSLRKETVQRTLGTQHSEEDLTNKLNALGFTATTQQTTITVEVPSYRHDIHQEIDLVEEICRTEPWDIKKSEPVPVYTPIYSLKRKIVDFLAHSGLQQFFTCDLLDTETASLDRQQEDSHTINLQGSKYATVLRTSLLPGLLKSTAINLNRQAPYVHAFELGTVYTKVKTQYKETQNLGIILAGQAENISWIPRNHVLSFFSIKGWLEKLFYHLRIPSSSYTIQESHHENFHPYQQAEIYLHKHMLGRFGTLHPQLCKKTRIKDPVFFAEISVDILLLTQKKSQKVYQPYPIYPSSFRDTTLTVPESLPADYLRRKLLSFPSKWLESVSIISIYQNRGSLPNKNVSLRLVFQNKERTLSNQEIEEEHERLLARLQQELNDTIGTIES
ncbi:phenylalanine--tRNA ligase subunit beta [Chlamydia avium]|uniref:Phenylalanine--tRNA ligase beta subunit n=1 Tax=Chlamydia avium TaxID=1457141 RepID=A0ABN0MSJ8_9CHLA|nr:phenylalanine--tRNA ligase subunit beta [Chlamydia avium]EPP36553.1 phenylalanine--tRNA ligase, beta subunit [Chlamydia psittaci 10_743_SC13]EPP38506.1 phenylalanine--tRNA ligase, beta subunit [Chlamydia avium]